jgi:hypothetical protein
MMIAQIAVSRSDNQLTRSAPNSASTLFRIPWSGLKIHSHITAATE